MTVGLLHEHFLHFVFQQEFLFESSSIREAAGGAIFPRTFNLSQVHTGSWALRSGVNISDLGSRSFVPNRTLVFRVPPNPREGHFPLSAATGAVKMQLESMPAFDDIVGVQVRARFIVFSLVASANICSTRARWFVVGLASSMEVRAHLMRRRSTWTFSADTMRMVDCCSQLDRLGVEMSRC